MGFWVSWGFAPCFSVCGMSYKVPLSLGFQGLRVAFPELQGFRFQFLSRKKPPYLPCGLNVHLSQPPASLVSVTLKLSTPKHEL